MELTPLERDILLAFVEKHPDFVSLDFVNSCEVTRREDSGCGFFTNFAPNKPAETLPEIYKASNFVLLNELKLTAPNLEFGADLLLIVTYGQIDYMEVLSFGDGHPLESVAWEIEDMAVNYIDLT